MAYLSALNDQRRYSNDSSIFSFVIRAGIFKKSMGARHRVGIGLSFRPATLASGIDALESIPGLHKRLKIRAEKKNRRFTWYPRLSKANFSNFLKCL
jgi:hypothetical protein